MVRSGLFSDVIIIKIKGINQLTYFGLVQDQDGNQNEVKIVEVVYPMNTIYSMFGNGERKG